MATIKVHTYENFVINETREEFIVHFSGGVVDYYISKKDYDLDPLSQFDIFQAVFFSKDGYSALFVDNYRKEKRIHGPFDLRNPISDNVLIFVDPNNPNQLLYDTKNKALITTKGVIYFDESLRLYDGTENRDIFAYDVELESVEDSDFFTIGPAFVEDFISDDMFESTILGIDDAGEFTFIDASIGQSR